jgi:hypothetical protein
MEVGAMTEPKGLLTVGELMLLLAEHPVEMPVLVDGYEGGYDRPHVHRRRVCKPEEYRPAWIGEYARALESDGDGPFDALVLSRGE